MKLITFFLGFAFLSLSFAEQYTDRYDDLNVDEVLSNKRLLSSYMKCILDKGRCTPEGKEIKVHIRDAIQNGCAKCTDTQKIKARIVVKHVRDNEKDFWEDLKKKFDPENIYKETYEAFLAGSN